MKHISKIKGAENPKTEKKRRETLEADRARDMLMGDVGEGSVDPLFLKHLEETRKDLDECLDELPERYKHLQTAQGKECIRDSSKKRKKSKTGWEKL